MKLSFLDYLSGNVPGGIWLVLFLLIATWFVLWFVYHFSNTLRRKHFLIWGIVISLFWVAVYSAFWISYPPPKKRKRILLSIREAPGHFETFAELYTIERKLYNLLYNRLPNNDFLICHPDWPLKLGNWNSLDQISYQEHIHQFMNADFVLTVEQSKNHDKNYGMLFRPSFPKDTLFQDQIYLSTSKLRNFANILVKSLSTSEIKSTLVNRESSESSWNNEIYIEWGKGCLTWLRQKLEKADQHFHNCLKKEPNFFPAYLGLAQIELDSARILRERGAYFQDHLALAQNYIFQYNNFDTNSAEAFRLWGEYAILSENFSMAENKLKQSYRLNPDNDQLYIDFSRLHPSRYKNIGFLNEEQLYRKALFLNPASIPSYIWYGDYLHRKNEIKTAFDLYNRILDDFPNHYQLQMTLGKLYISTQKYQAARNMFETMLENHPQESELINFNLGITRFHQGDTLAAKGIFEQMASKGCNPDVYLYLGYIAEKQGNIDQAIHYLRKRIRQNRGRNDPFAEEARRHLALLLKRQGAQKE